MFEQVIDLEKQNWPCKPFLKGHEDGYSMWEPFTH